MDRPATTAVRKRAFALAAAEAALFAVLGVVAWASAPRTAEAPAWDGQAHGYAYSTGRRDADAIEREVRLLARHTRRVRLYSSTDLRAARDLEREGIEVLAGAWLSGHRKADERELRALAAAVREHANIAGAVVGNESVLRGDLTPARLAARLDDARAAFRVPVSTAEPFHIWMMHPELAEHVDFIVVHLLPYWDGIALAHGVDRVVAQYRILQARFPGKRIVIGEVGWPSAGPSQGEAAASRLDQGVFLRRMLQRLQAHGWEYYVLEAFDQPWKVRGERLAGAHWGVFDADGEPKFAWSGPVRDDPHVRFKALSASALAFPFLLLFALRARHLRPWGRWLFLAMLQGAFMSAVWMLALPWDYYPGAWGWLLFAILFALQTFAFVHLLAGGFELLETLAQPRWRRQAAPCPGRPGFAPKISIHLPCYNEPPQVVIETLDSLARLDYPDYEVLVIDNNTRDEAVWRPVQARCRALGRRFRFFHLDHWPGFKAGALNFALRHTDPRAEIVAIVDSDYVVRPEWLRDLAGHFEDPRVGAVQAPQAHREYARHPFWRMCNWESESFFRVGMHHRHERDAIIVHGTLIMVRRALLDRLGWSEWCICEDTELGLRLQRAGYRALYVDRVYGRGLLPDDFAAYKAQRFRWAFGAMQIFRRHVPSLLRPGGLTPSQRYHYLAGWLPWFAGAAHAAFTACAIALGVGHLLAPAWDSLPFQAFAALGAASLGLKLVSGLILHRRRVSPGWRDTAGALIAELALTHAIARAVLRSAFTPRLPFRRTGKGAARAPAQRAGAAVVEEFGLFLAIWLCILALLWQRGTDDALTLAWAGMLSVQSLPYAAALYCEWLSSRQASQRRADVPVSSAPKWAGAFQGAGARAEAPNQARPAPPPARRAGLNPPRRP